MLTLQTGDLNLDPAALNPVIEQESGQVGHAHVPHGCSGGDQENEEVLPPEPDVPDHQGQFHAGKKENDAQNRAGKYLKKSGTTESLKKRPVRRTISTPGLRVPHPSWRQTDMASHSAGAMAKGNPSQAGADQIHQPVIEGMVLAVTFRSGKVRVVFRDGSDDGVAQGERSLGEPQNETSGKKLRPGHPAEGESPAAGNGWKDFGEFREKSGFCQEGDQDPIEQEEPSIGRNSLLTKKQESQHRPSHGKPGALPSSSPAPQR